MGIGNWELGGIGGIRNWELGILEVIRVYEHIMTGMSNGKRESMSMIRIMIKNVSSPDILTPNT